MAKKINVAVFLLCIVVVATAINCVNAQDETPEQKSCYEECEKECEGEGNGYTFCEMKCDATCATGELKSTYTLILLYKYVIFV